MDHFESELLLKEQNQESPRFSLGRYSKQKNGSLIAFLTVLILLLSGLNFLQYWWRASNNGNVEANEKANRSYYANLLNDELKVKWTQASVLTSGNETERDHAWDSISYDNGIVAVPKDWAEEKGLPIGSTFPWDTSKAIYLVNGYHNLHCLKNIYRSLMEYRKGQPQSLAEHHVTHCLDELVTDVKCNSDDTLRYTKVGAGKNTGMGQLKTCRNWGKLEKWTLENAGCYRYGNPNIEDAKTSQIPRFRFCPEGSKDLARVREYFKKGEDWKPYQEKEWSWDEGFTSSESGLEDWVKPL